MTLILYYKTQDTSLFVRDVSYVIRFAPGGSKKFKDHSVIAQMRFHAIQKRFVSKPQFDEIDLRIAEMLLNDVFDGLYAEMVKEQAVPYEIVTIDACAFRRGDLFVN